MAAQRTSSRGSEKSCVVRASLREKPQPRRKEPAVSGGRLPPQGCHPSSCVIQCTWLELEDQARVTQVSRPTSQWAPDYDLDLMTPWKRRAASSVFVGSHPPNQVFCRMCTTLASRCQQAVRTSITGPRTCYRFSSGSPPRLSLRSSSGSKSRTY